MVASNSSFRPGSRRSRSVVPCYHDWRCSLSGADAATSHRQPLYHTYPVSSRIRICCSRADVAPTGVSGRAGEEAITTAQTPQDRLTVVPAQAAPTAPPTLAARGITRSGVAAIAATAALSATPSTPTTRLHGRNPCVFTGVNPSRASLGQQRGVARASSGISGKTAGTTQKNTHHTYDREEPGTLVCRREDPQSIRRLKKLHVLPAGPRAESWQVLRVLKMYMREKKVVTSCMSFQVPLETASTTFNSPSGETPACEAEEAARVATSDSDASKSSGVSSPHCQRNLFSCSFSSSFTPVPSSCPAGAPSSVHHCEFSPSSSDCMSSATVSTVSYTAVRSHSPHYQTARVFSSSTCESACDSVTAFRYSPKRFLSSKASSLSQLRCPSTACCPSSSSASSSLRTASPSFDSASRSTTYVVVDCSPASGLLTADTLVYLSGAPLQRLRRVQLMALVHPNSAYGRRAGICSYQQVFERRPDFPYLEQEDYQLLREAPTHFRDFARTLQIPTEAAACVEEAEADTAGGAAASDTTEENSIHAFDTEKRDTSPSLRSSASSGTAVGGVAEIGEATSTCMGETDGDSTHTCYMDTREEALPPEEITVKKMLIRRGVALAERQDSDQPRREKTQVLFRGGTSRETDTTLPDLNHRLDDDKDGGADRVPAVDPLHVGKESIKQHRKATGAACNSHLSGASADSLAATPSPVASLTLANGGRATVLTAVPSTAFVSADIFTKSNTPFHRKVHADDACSRRPSFWLKRSVVGASIDAVDVCHPHSALTASYNTIKRSGGFRSRSLEIFCCDPNSNGCVRRNKVSSSIRSDHESRRSTRRVKSSCCFGSSKSTSHFLVETNASYGWDASTASRSSSSSGSRRSRSRQQSAAVSTVEIPFSSGVSRGGSSVQNFSTSSGGAFDVICNSRTDEGPFIRGNSGAASLTHSFFLARKKDVTEDCREVAELPHAAHESHSAPTARPASEDKRPCSIRENEDLLPHRLHGSSDVLTQQRTIRRVSHAQQQQRITLTQRGRRMLHIGRQRGDGPEEAASSSSHSSNAGAQMTAVERDKFPASSEIEENTSVKDVGSQRARPQSEAEAFRDRATTESRTSGEIAESRGRARQVAQRTRENDKAKSGGRAEKRRGKAADEGERSADGHLPEAEKLSARDAASLRGGNEGKETARTAVTGRLIAAERAVTAGIGKTAGKTTIGGTRATGVKRGSLDSVGERDGRVRSTTHDHEQMQLQRLDAETLFRFFLGPYLLRKLGTRNSASVGFEKRAEITGNGEEETACRSNGRIAESPAFRCRGRPRGEVSGKKEEDQETSRQELIRGDGDARRTSEMGKKQKSTLVLYPGKELVIKDITFVVWAADPAGVPGLLDEDTVIYICLDPYGEYRRVHFIPFSDTLPTTYTFDFYEDYLKPFLLENKWRNFRRGDVFSYRGVEFKLIATDPSSTVGARVGPATVVYHEGTMQPTVMDVLPGDVLHHIRRLPARMQPAAIIFAAQRLDPEVLMRVMPSNSANRSRRGLDEHTAEILRERLVRPFSFAAYLKKNASLCCHLSPSTTERPSEEARTTGVRARMTCSDRHPITCWTENCACSPSAPGIMRHDPTGNQRSSEISGCRAPWDVTLQKGYEGTVSAGVASAPAGDSLENAHGGKPATDCAAQVASCHMARGRAYGSPTDGACGKSVFHHTQHGSPLEEEEHSISQHNREEDMDNRERPSCTVCTLPMEERDASILLYCGHVFHWQCIHLWLRHNSTCPNCRAEIAELLRQHEDSLRRRGTDPNVQTLEQGESGGGGGDGTEEDGALWLLNTVRRVVSGALFGMQL